MDLQEMGCGGMDWIGLAQVAGSCECGNELSGSIKRGQFLDRFVSQGLCSME
jgi:hypothetical protein